MSEITASVDATHLMVKLNLNAALPEFLGLIADAYGDDPAAVGQLLMDLAGARIHLDDALQGAERRNTPDWVIEHAGAAVDAAVEDLSAVLLEHCEMAVNYQEALDIAASVTVAASQTTSAKLRLLAAS